MANVIIEEPEMTSSPWPGVHLSRIQPGGRFGPDNVVLRETPCGQGWNSNWLLGSEDDDFQLSIPDIRMPANQFWPLHWHDTWIAIIVLDGSCLCGDWWMHPGDVLISPAFLEYGPLVNGPSGCHLFEIFADAALIQGGYAREYHDHPTLEGLNMPFYDRSPLNARNAGNQVLPMEGSGLVADRLRPGARWELGEPDDPRRGVVLCTDIAAGATLPARRYADWRAIFVLEGEMTVGERRLQKDDVLVIERNAELGAFEAGASGVRLLEVARTAAGL